MYGIWLVLCACVTASVLAFVRFQSNTLKSLYFRKSVLRKQGLDFSPSLAFIGWLPSWKVIVLLTMFVLMAVMTFQILFPCWMLRMRRCRLGSIPGHVMSFRFVTLDMQVMKQLFLNELLKSEAILKTQNE